MAPGRLPRLRSMTLESPMFKMEEDHIPVELRGGQALFDQDGNGAGSKWVMSLLPDDGPPASAKPGPPPLTTGLESAGWPASAAPPPMLAASDEIHPNDRRYRPAASGRT